MAQFEPVLPAPQKPDFGDPCNGCGLCCKAIPCPIATVALGVTEGACPALEFEGGRYWCGLLLGAHNHIPGLKGKPWAGDVFRNLMMQTGAFGCGCDSD